MASLHRILGMYSAIKQYRVHCLTWELEYQLWTIALLCTLQVTIKSFIWSLDRRWDKNLWSSPQLLHAWQQLFAWAANYEKLYNNVFKLKYKSKAVILFTSSHFVSVRLLVSLLNFFENVTVIVYVHSSTCSLGSIHVRADRCNSTSFLPSYVIISNYSTSLVDNFCKSSISSLSQSAFRKQPQVCRLLVRKPWNFRLHVAQRGEADGDCDIFCKFGQRIYWFRSCCRWNVLL